MSFNIPVNHFSVISGQGLGYPHEGHDDNAAYPHDDRADKRRFRHDLRAPMLQVLAISTTGV